MSAAASADGDEMASIKLQDCLDLFVKGTYIRANSEAQEGLQFPYQPKCGPS